MPWTAESGHTYGLCLLDTNALSETVKNPRVEGRGFVERFGPDSYAPCFTIYNLIELRRNESLFEAFVDFFAVYPCFLLKPHQLIRDEEKTAAGNLSAVSVLMHAFTPVGPDSSYDLRRFIDGLFSDREILKFERNWRREELETLQVWLSRKSNFESKRSVPNARDAAVYVEEAGLQSLIASMPRWAKTELEAERIPNIDDFPSIKVILYSQYYRLYDPHWKPLPQDVTDVLIVSAAPYVDVVVTEAFQAEILKKIRKRVKGLESLEITTLRGIRFKGDK